LYFTLLACQLVYITTMVLCYLYGCGGVYIWSQIITLKIPVLISLSETNIGHYNEIFVYSYYTTITPTMFISTCHYDQTTNWNKICLFWRRVVLLVVLCILVGITNKALPMLTVMSRFTRHVTIPLLCYKYLLGPNCNVEPACRRSTNVCRICIN
jgi:hypothetical protein